MLPKIESIAIIKAYNPKVGNSFIILSSLPILYPIMLRRKNREAVCKIPVLFFSLNGIKLYLLKKNPKQIIKTYSKILIKLITPL